MISVNKKLKFLISCLLLNCLFIGSNCKSINNVQVITQLKNIIRTHSIVRYLYMEQLTQESIYLQISTFSHFNCLFCPKKFRNQSYLYLHYALKHLDCLIPNPLQSNSHKNQNPFNELVLNVLYQKSENGFGRVFDKIFYHSYSYHTKNQRQNLLKYCRQWYKLLQQNINKIGINSDKNLKCILSECRYLDPMHKYPLQYQYVVKNGPDRLCKIIIDRQYEDNKMLIIIKIVGAIVIGLITLAFVFHERKIEHYKLE